jgi:hypothetical protein
VREPLLLCVDEGLLAARWGAVVSRLGWAADAQDVVLADPAALLRDDALRALG